MSLSERVDQDLKSAMKSGEALKVATLRMLKAAVNNYLIEKRKDKPDDTEMMTLIQKQIKQREDSIESFKKSLRQDLIDKETQEKKILQTYLPPPLTDSELQALVATVIRETGAKAKSDMGRVMKECVTRSAGRADGKRISELAGKLLTP